MLNFRSMYLHANVTHAHQNHLDILVKMKKAQACHGGDFQKLIEFVIIYLKFLLIAPQK